MLYYNLQTGTVALPQTLATQKKFRGGRGGGIVIADPEELVGGAHSAILVWKNSACYEVYLLFESSLLKKL